MNSNPPIRGLAYTFYLSLPAQSDPKVMMPNPTLSAGDVKIAKDDGAPANINTLPVVDADFTKRVKVVVSASEMDADNVSIIFSDAAGAEWCDVTINIQTMGMVLGGTVNDGAAATGDFDTTLTGLGDDRLNGGFLVFTDGALQGVARPISDYTSTSGNFVFVGSEVWPTAPANGDPFIVIGRKA